jgi:transcriptional regulator with XRE-family HTH domain
METLTTNWKILKANDLQSNILAMRFHDKLKLAMKQNGLDRDDLIRAVAVHGQDLTKSTLSNYLKGDTRPSMMMALALARVLKISLDYLADDQVAEAPQVQGALSPDERAVIALYRVKREIEGERFTPEELGRRVEQGGYRDAGIMLPGRRLGDVGTQTGNENPKVAAKPET